MWLSERLYKRPGAGAESGDVTIGGEKAAVMLSGERRTLPPALPGGYFWFPKEEQEALIIRDEDGLRYVAGLLGEEERVKPEIEPGQVAIICEKYRIYIKEDSIQICGEECSISLEKDTVSIEGRLLLNGIDVEQAITGGGE